MNKVYFYLFCSSCSLTSVLLGRPTYMHKWEISYDVNQPLSCVHIETPRNSENNLIQQPLKSDNIGGP
ncbi:hypothetical protein GcM1_c1719o7 [Golovinomyces cichoracearum]|uniref:Uncharacterized protein n=1 Tax=Golovinomyces cichoracearum TaxID=62708 RepID=A0A420IMU0_9PEZI|nr:hypothetical protein GcM1_c1719o7 [Golovinomyces cichoracearum]